MFNIGSGELALIAVVALLVLGPKRLPELARGIGKFMREFRRQTDEVRGVVEREFYKMDADVSLEETHQLSVPEGLEHANASLDEQMHSQLSAGAAQAQEIVASPVVPEPIQAFAPEAPAVDKKPS